MQLFYQREKVDVAKTTEMVGKAYGITNPEKVGGFTGTFLFSIGDVYVSDYLGDIILRDKSFGEILSGAIHRFIKEDYGVVSDDEGLENCEQRYFGNGTFMIGRYPSEYGNIILRTRPECTLLQLESE